MFRLIGSIFVTTVARLFVGRARAGARPLVGLCALVLLAGAGFATPSASQTVRVEVPPTVTMSDGTLYVSWQLTSGPVDMFSLTYGDARYAVVRINGVDYGAEAFDWRLVGSPRRGILHYQGLNSNALPDGTVSRMTVNGRTYVDHASYRLLLPNLPEPVPTLSEWAMIVFGLLLAGGAAHYIQRRRTTADGEPT